PAPTRSATPSTLTASWNANSGPREIGRVTRKSSMAPVTGPDAANTTERANEHPLEDERPAHEGVGRTDQLHDLDLVAARVHGDADRVDDHEQRYEQHHRQDRDASDGQDARDREQLIDDLRVVDDVG